MICSTFQVRSSLPLEKYWTQEQSDRTSLCLNNVVSFEILQSFDSKPQKELTLQRNALVYQMILLSWKLHSLDGSSNGFLRPFLTVQCTHFTEEHSIRNPHSFAKLKMEINGNGRTSEENTRVSISREESHQKNIPLKLLDIDISCKCRSFQILNKVCIHGFEMRICFMQKSKFLNSIIVICPNLTLIMTSQRLINAQH